MDGELTGGLKERESLKDRLLKVAYVAMFVWFCLYMVTGFMVLDTEGTWEDAMDDSSNASVYSRFVSDIVADDADVLKKVGARPEPGPVQVKPSTNMNVLITQNVMDINRMQGQIKQMRDEADRHNMWA